MSFLPVMLLQPGAGSERFIGVLINQIARRPAICQ
jgi:hypothetical protein